MSEVAVIINLVGIPRVTTVQHLDAGDVGHLVAFIPPRHESPITGVLQSITQTTTLRGTMPVPVTRLRIGEHRTRRSWRPPWFHDWDLAQSQPIEIGDIPGRTSRGNSTPKSVADRLDPAQRQALNRLLQQNEN